MSYFYMNLGTTPMYVRNPPGSRHTPSSAGGCTILVKLRQMHPEDNEFVRLNTRQESLWKPGRSGESILPLYSGHGENVRMLRWESGANFPVQRFDGGVEYFLINGSFQDACGIYADGAWLRLPGVPINQFKCAKTPCCSARPDTSSSPYFSPGD